MLLFDDIAAEYRDFASYADGDSPTFADWAGRLAEDAEVIAWLADLPAIKHQPNLVFAAARFHGVPAPGPYTALREALLGPDGAAIRRTILTHATQTNEVGRLATLLPAFAQIEGPLALIEVGASAGLCLYPDRWSYDWTTDSGAVRLGDGPALECRVKGEAPLPTQLPDVAWRGGIDLNPLDVTDTDDMTWLETLVWPEHDDRRERLRTAVDVARSSPPRIVRGDLLTELPALVEEASSYGTVVVFHSAVIAYLTPEDRLRFEALVRGLVADGMCHWVSNEGKRVIPSITATGPVIPEEKQMFVLGLDGQALAHTHGHGRFMRWL
ncbi:DUF2332 domain-containing protein [Nocardioides sp. Kera G14]|uniref:DUF2332 domain-containing protein n=1 Tax=Nocardioides sp. Kera G14 TaxID=2884264 RepID=UPI001D0F7803|nr:DUF2332 domain-containing protein [Nocardioides sp. Kera G14]UDY22269.1 DUF2332 domain-containing protein [Nocardioides sp. Kera G14]